MEFKFGVRGHDIISKGSPEDFAKAIASYGFHYVQLVFPKAFGDYSYSDEYVARVKKALDKNNIKVAMLGAYFNPVHSDINVVEKGINNFKENIRISHVFGEDVPVGSETGSFNDSPWIYVPKNRTEEGYQQSKAVFADLAKVGLENNVPLTIEPAFGHVMWNVETLKRLIGEISLPNVFETIDLYNLLDASNFESRDEIFHLAVSTFGPTVRIIHLKDAKVIDGKLTQMAPGEGEFHYEFMLREIAKYCPNAVLVFEGVLPDKIQKSYSYLKNVAKNL